MSGLAVLSGREASMFAALADAAVDPDEALPPVAATDALAFFDDYLERSPLLNRAGLRALLHLLEVAPLAGPHHARLRRLPRDERPAELDRLEHGPLAQAVRALTSLAQLAYYGDDTISRGLGYDPDAVVERARAVRAEEGRW